jgi:hypothetical protein
MSKSHIGIFVAVFLSLSVMFPPAAFAQGSQPMPTAPPAGHQSMQPPENEGFMGYAIESGTAFELANLFVVMDPEALLKNSGVRIPEGMLFIGTQRLMLTDVKLEKNSAYNYDPSKPEGIKPKVITIKAKIVAALIESETMPEIPGKSAGEKDKGKDENASSKNELDVRIFEKLIEGGRKIPVLAGTASYNGKKHDLYFNFLPPFPQGMTPPPGGAAPIPEQKPPMQIK